MRNYKKYIIVKIRFGSRKRRSCKCRLLNLVAANKIAGQFPRTSEGALFAGVIERAILDLAIPAERDSALSYLVGDIPHAKAFGVDPGWVKKVLRQYRLIPPC